MLYNNCGMKKKPLAILPVIILLIIAGVFLTKNLQGGFSIEKKLPITAMLPQQNVVGAYVGKLPCASCEGIDHTITLNTDNTYEHMFVYLGANVAPLIETGTWEKSNGTPKDPKAAVYMLKEDVTGGITNYLIVDKTHIKQLDINLNEIQAPFDTTLTLKAN